MANDVPPSICTYTLLSQPFKARTMRVYNLLRAIQVPCDTDLADFRVVVQQSPAILQDIDQKITHARALLDNLVAARKQAESNLADAKSLLHPIRSVPNEILNEIFTYCVPSYQIVGSGYDSLNSHCAPWTLARVCHNWRVLVISSPLLWSYFVFDPSSHHKMHISRQECVERTSIYLERSGNLSLSIILIDKHDRIVDHPVLPALKLAMSRCAYLVVETSTLSLQSLSGTVFPRLYRLAVIGAHKSDRKVQVDTFNSVSAPALSELVCSDHRWESMQYVSVPWTQLNRVYRLPVFEDIALGWLRNIHGVKRLEVAIFRSCIPRDTVIPLPKLRTISLIEVVNAEPGCLKEFVSALVVDALEYLRLEYPMQRLLHFPGPSGFAENLRSVAIKCTTHGHPDNIRNLLDFLSNLPRVHSLILENNPLETAFLGGLQCYPTTTMLPRLEYLNISRCSTPPSDLSALFDMLQSRCIIPQGALEDGSTSSVTSTSSRQRLCHLGAPQWLLLQDDRRWKEISKCVKLVL